MICDTDVIIDYLDHRTKRHGDARKILDQTGFDHFSISVITVFELVQGVSNKSELNVLKKNIHDFQILDIVPAISQSALVIYEDFRLSHGLSIPDSLVAATAIYLDLQLFTWNTKDYKFIKGLKLFKP